MVANYGHLCLIENGGTPPEKIMAQQQFPKFSPKFLPMCPVKMLIVGGRPKFHWRIWTSVPRLGPSWIDNGDLMLLNGIQYDRVS